jgi:hypothetical protein
MHARIAKARQWLLAATPVTSEERNMRLLGLYWAGADAATLKPLAAAIAAAQQSDGGWRQIDALRPDAYATGQSLYALAKAGMSASDPVYARAWHSCWRRRPRTDRGGHEPLAEVQAYFNSGFPTRRPVDQRLGHRLGDDGARASRHDRGRLVIGTGNDWVIDW